jgi:hypothetical protein
MADLPSDRMVQEAPFTNTGLDVFGPWKVSEGRATRRVVGHTKCWALVLTCLSSRAVHVEILPNMDTNSFKNALRRFFAIRGGCKLLRSDRGSNFLGAFNQTEDDVDLEALQNDLRSRDCEWIFNTPRSSHHGGVWERKIGSLRRILDATLVQVGPRTLSKDELHTFLLESVAIVNSTPLGEVSFSPDDPLAVCPAMLLTLKEQGHTAAAENYSEGDLLAYGKRRWRRVQFLADMFWQGWQRDYLQTLQTRRKWSQPKNASSNPGTS